jgi:hypothetical protein
LTFAAFVPSLANNADLQFSMAAVASMIPGATDGKALATQMEAALKKQPPKRYIHAAGHAFAFYRADRLDDARREAERACEEHPNGGLPWDWYLLAMIHHRQGRDDKAREWQRRAQTWLDTAPLDTPLSIEEFDNNPNAPVGIAWLMFRIVRREADKVLETAKR